MSETAEQLTLLVPWPSSMGALDISDYEGQIDIISTGDSFRIISATPYHGGLGSSGRIQLEIERLPGGIEK